MTAAILIFAALITADPTDADWEWLSEYRDRGLEAVMPLADQPGAYVAFRSYRDLYQDVREQYFLIRDDPSGPRAVVATPLGASIQQQMLAAHMRASALPLESVLAGVRVSTARVDGTACPAVANALAKLDRLRLRTPDRGTIIIHPVVYKLVVAYSSGHINAAYYEDDHPAARWARETYLRLARCAGLAIEAPW